MSTPTEQVRVLLDLAGLSPSPGELDVLVADFPRLRASVERLWSLDLGDTPPSLVFRAGEAVGVGEA